MARTDPQFNIRLPADLASEVKVSAAANNRSMNSEIVARLSGEQRTLRDWFAGQAMAAIIAKMPLMSEYSDNDDLPGVVVSDGQCDSIMREVVSGAYRYADAMLAERSK